MAVIPRRVYDECEHKLYRRADLVDRASEKLMFAQSKAYSIRTPMPEPLTDDQIKRPGVNPNTIHGSCAGDQVEHAALAVIQAEAELRAARKWVEIFVRLDEIFAGKPEAAVAEALYVQHKKQKDVADALKYDRQSVRRLRDSYVCHCALLAAAKGLIIIQEGENDA